MWEDENVVRLVVQLVCCWAGRERNNQPSTGATKVMDRTAAGETTMAADDDDKEVDGDGTRRSFRGGYDKGVVVEGVARAAKKAGSLSSLPSSESWASTTATRPSFQGGGAIKASPVRES